MLKLVLKSSDFLVGPGGALIFGCILETEELIRSVSACQASLSKRHRQ